MKLIVGLFMIAAGFTTFLWIPEPWVFFSSFVFGVVGGTQLMMWWIGD